MIYKTLGNGRRLIWVFIFAACLNACKKTPKENQGQTISFRKDELIMVYPPNLTPQARADIRLKLLSNYQITKTTPCICDSSIEIISAPGADTFINDSTTVRSSTSHQTVILNGDKLIVSKNVQLKGLPNSINAGFAAASYSVPRGSVRVAIIDSGLDTANYFTASSYNNFLLPSTASLYNLVGIRNPALFSGSRFFGWNFIKNNQDIMDDNNIKHGTHVTGLVLAQAKDKGPEIIPLKVSDASGISDLSHILCALRFAELANANIINASWGYDGIPNQGLEDAINRLAAKKILIIAAAGNSNHNIAVDPHYPASFSNDPLRSMSNIITVTAASSSAVCEPTNYSNVHVDVGVAGKSDQCSYTSPFYPSSSGTTIVAQSSFATAVMTGIVANRYPGINTSGGVLKNTVLNDILANVPVAPSLGSKIRTSKRLTQ